MTTCSSSQQLAHNLSRCSARLESAGGPVVAQVMSSFVGELPPLQSATGGSSLTKSSVEAFAGLYYYAELENASLITLAELVVEERYTLEINDRPLFEALESMSERMRQGWYDQNRRSMLFNRVTAFGSSNDIRQPLSTAVEALYRFDEVRRYGQVHSSAVVAVEIAFVALLNVLASNASLGVERAAQVLNGQLQLALSVLGNSALHRQFQVQDMWGLVRALMVSEQGQTPDPSAIVERAQSGAAIIAWAANQLSLITTRGGGLERVLANEATLMRQAVRWRMAARTLNLPNSSYDASPSRQGLRNPVGGWT